MRPSRILAQACVNLWGVKCEGRLLDRSCFESSALEQDRARICTRAHLNLYTGPGIESPGFIHYIRQNMLSRSAHLRTVSASSPRPLRLALSFRQRAHGAWTWDDVNSRAGSHLAAGFGVNGHDEEERSGTSRGGSLWGRHRVGQNGGFGGSAAPWGCLSSLSWGRDLYEGSISSKTGCSTTVFRRGYSSVPMHYGRGSVAQLRAGFGRGGSSDSFCGGEDGSILHHFIAFHNILYPVAII